MKFRTFFACIVLAVGMVVGVTATPSVAAGEHCSSHTDWSSTYVSLDFVYYAGPYWQIWYRHCGNGGSPEQYYYRADSINFGSSNNSALYYNVTVHWSVKNVAHTVTYNTGSATTVTGATVSMGSIAVTHPAYRAWSHVDWLPGGSADTVTWESQPEYNGQ